MVDLSNLTPTPDPEAAPADESTQPEVEETESDLADLAWKMPMICFQPQPITALFDIQPSTDSTGHACVSFAATDQPAKVYIVSAENAFKIAKRFQLMARRAMLQIPNQGLVVARGR